MKLFFFLFLIKLTTIWIKIKEVFFWHMQIYISHAFFVGKFMAVICQSREYFVTEPAHNTRHRWTSDSSQTGNLPLSSFQITQRLRHGALHLRVTIALVSSALRSRNAYVMSLITFLKHIRSKLSWRSIIPLRLLFASTFSLFELSFFMLNHCRVSYYLKITIFNKKPILWF